MSYPLEPKEGFTFGCDPEIFIKDENGKYVCPDFIPGTKAEPHKVNLGAVQRDGMAAEFNIDPVSSFNDWNRNIVEVMRQLRGMLPKGYTFDISPSVRFTQDVFDNAPDDAKELGCTPDFNAWTGELTPTPNTDNDPLLRCAGGHVHIGWSDGNDVTDPQHMANCIDLTKQLDWYLGGWALRIDKDADRRKLYGLAGAFRPKDYGVEYRTLSNFWIGSKEHRLLVWNRMVTAIASMRSRYLPDHYPPSYQTRLVDSINSSVMHETLASDCYYPLVSIR
jgi:hypothetical protein